MTEASDHEVKLRWDPPRKGGWIGLHDHFPRPLTPEHERLLATGMEAGEGDWFARYGLPARTLVPAFVHGRVFITAAPLVGPPSDRLPPFSLLWLAVRLLPAFRRRSHAATTALDRRPWLAEARRWFEVGRGEWQRRNGALHAIDPAQLDMDDLVLHLREAQLNALAGYREHFGLHGCDLMPTALLLTRAADWGIPAAEAVVLLTGWSPVSRGEAEVPSTQLVTGYGLDDLCAGELPERTATRSSKERTVDGSVETELRDRVPADARDEWDQLVADARETYGVRDDNGLLTAAWPVGLLRRAMLEAGRRLGLGDPALAVEATVEELLVMLAGGGAGPSHVSLTERAILRRRLAAVQPPAVLGRQPDLPLGALPAAMRTMAAALLTTRDLGTTVVSSRGELTGVGIGTEIVRGRACVAADAPTALGSFEPGDILVTNATCPAWSSVLRLAGGVVTEEGGPLSHAAVIARELGLPAVVGCLGAMQIPDGADVTLDPQTGHVHVHPSGTV